MDIIEYNTKHISIPHGQAVLIIPVFALYAYLGRVIADKSCNLPGAFKHQKLAKN
jgi:hypothetical protein